MGQIHQFNLYEQQPIKLKSLTTVGVLQIGQIILEAAIICIPGLGNALISEGIGNIIAAIKGGVTRIFSWDNYVLQKAISMTISLVTLGTGKMSIPVGMIESVDQQLIFQSKEILAQAKYFTKNILNQIKVGVKASSAIKHTAIQGVNYCVDYCIDLALDQLKDKIISQVELKLKTVFEHPKIQKAIAIDNYRNRDQYIMQIQSQAIRMLCQKKSMISYFISRISTKILENNKLIDKCVQSAKLLVGHMDTIHQILPIIDNFYALFEKKFDKLKIPKTCELLIQNLQLNQRQRQKILQNIDSESEQCLGLLIKKIKQQQKKYPDSEIIEIVQKNIVRLKQCNVGRYQTEINILQAKICRAITQIIIQNIYNGIVRPTNNILVSKGVSKVFNKLERYVNRGKNVEQQVKLLQDLTNLQGKHIKFMKQLTKQEKKQY